MRNTGQPDFRFLYRPTPERLPRWVYRLWAWF